MSPPNTASLYGITQANSSRHGPELWGKNLFNSTFPLALCLYMRDHGQHPVAVVSDGEGGFMESDKHWKMQDLVGAQESSPYYRFECGFGPYESYSRNKVDKIDLVVEIEGEHYLPLEIKLTVVPDDSTVSMDEEGWRPEMVIRPVSSAYAMMGVAKSLNDSPELKTRVMHAIRPAYNAISNWGSTLEIEQNSGMLRSGLTEALAIASPLQKPFLVQPIWRTQGQSFALCEQCLDVFVWSDVAVMMLPVMLSESSNKTRAMREVARHVRAIYDLLSQNDYDYTAIYKGMALGLQTDKAFAVSGKGIGRYISHERMRKPLLPPESLMRIILGDGHRELKPERRFDAAVVSYIAQHVDGMQ